MHRRLLAGSLLTAVLVGLVVVSVATIPGAIDRGRGLTPADAVATALENARAAGSYRVTADLDQVIVPRASAQTIGQGEREVSLRIEGEAQVPDRARLNLTLPARSGRAGDLDTKATFGARTATSVKLLLVEDRAFVGHNGEWREVENPLGAAAPTADYLSLLSAVRNVERVRDYPAGDTGAAAHSARSSADPIAGHYRFELDGPRYAEHLRDRMETLLANDLPPGVTLEAPDVYKQMTGTGELYVDRDGLPRRLLVDMWLPEVSDSSGASVSMLIDFSDHGTEMDPIEAPALDAPDGGEVASASSQTDPPDGPWQATNDGKAVGRTTIALRGKLPNVFAYGLVPILLLASACLTLVWRRRPIVYAAIVAAVVASLVLSPLAHAAAMNRFTARLSDAPPLSDALADLGLAAPTDEPDRVADLVRALAGDPSGPTGVEDCLHLPGGIDPDGDEDNDGLDNGTERCLGTDYLNADTDSDTITDTLELAGFTIGDGDGAKTWATNPLLRDSNHDGMDDASEWNPAWVRAKPETLDFDGDGVPNAWDEDNDGDGVPDAPDLSPYSALPYQASYEIEVTKPLDDALHNDTYVYVDLQVQPHDTDHLRYTTTALDWPHDEKAQIQDLDDSSDDVKLIPMLEMKSTTKPSMAAEYGIVVQDGGVGEPYRYLVPLATLASDGTIVAFRTRLAFTPPEAKELDLFDIRLGWLALAALDRYKCEGSPGNSSCGQRVIETDQSVIVSYYEDTFRITGLNIVENRDVQAALFGVPDAPEITDGTVPDELREMANLVSGLTPAFLYHTEPTLDDIEDRFTNPDTPAKERWGVSSSVAIDLQEYEHQDLAMATTTMTTTQSFLSDNYTHDRIPALALVYQEDTGVVVAVDGGPGFTVTGNGTLRFDLSLNTLHTVRQVQLHQYRYTQDAGTPSWSALSMNDALTDLDRRYTDLEQADFAHYIKVLFLAWYAGHVNFVAVNGHPRVGERADDQAIFDMLNLPDQKRLPGFVVSAYHLDQLQARIDLDGAVSGWREWAAEEFDQSGASEGFGPFVSEVGSLAVSLAPAIYWIGRGISALFRTVAGAASAAGEASEAASGVETAAETAGSVAKAIAGLAIAIAVIVAIVAIVLIWSSFHGYSDNVSHMQTDMELAYDIAATILIVVSLAISLIITIITTVLEVTGVGFIIELAIIIVLYILVAIVTGDWNPLHTFDWLAKWLAEFILWTSYYTQIPEKNAISSGPLSLVLGDAKKGTVAGNSVTFGTRMTTTVVVGPGWKDSKHAIHSREGRVSDLKDSWAFARWDATGSGPVPNNTEYLDACVTAGTAKRCPSTTSVKSVPTSPQVNFPTEITNVLHFRLAYQKCFYVWIPFITHFWVCSGDHAEDTQPADDDTANREKSTIPIYLDVLPTTVQGLWEWSDLANPDPDGDGLSSSTEATLGTNPHEWDTDGDGLADGFEHDMATEMGTDPLAADGDGDGLDDIQEIRLGTTLDVADTDGDGLTDGEESCHVDATGSFSGGWRATQVGDQWVCSNPLDPDADRDALPDGTEKALGLSPFGPNTAPRAHLTAAPQVVHDGASIVLRKPGDRIPSAFDVFNDTAAPVSSTMRLCAAADTFTPITATSAVGSPGYTPPDASSARIGAQACASWDFGAEPLMTGERMTATAQTTVLENASSHKATPLTLSLPYVNPTDQSHQVVEQHVTIMVDAEAPVAAIITPTHEIAIDGSSFVVGGTAIDATSWITKVEVAVDGDVGWQEASGLDTWAWTWSPLPADEEYTIRARSTDAVGHVSEDATGKVIVDNTPPGASFTSVTDGEVLTQLVPDTTGGATLRLQGEADDTLSGASRVSGVARVQLSTDGRPWETVWEIGARPIAPATTRWSHNWRLSAAATGSHTLELRAVDALGHVGETTAVTVIVDLIPPANIVSNSTAVIPVGKPFTLRGHADETGFLPPVPRPEPLRDTLDAVADATVWLGPPSPESAQSLTATWLGDVNGDGRADLAVGLPHDNGGAGRVAIIHGRAGGWPVPPQPATLANPDASLIVGGATGIGTHLAPAGDVNADGLSDILVGDVGAGVVYLVFGRTGGLGLDLDLNGLSGTNRAGGATLVSSVGQVGAWIAAAGDVNGDGYGDLLIGATDPQGVQGHAYLVTGRHAFFSPFTDVAADAALDVSLDPDGAPVTGAGDVNGDELADFVLADPNGASGIGAAVFLILGDAGYRHVSAGSPQQRLDPVTDAAATFAGEGAGRQVVALGDLDADSYADFAYMSGAGPQIVFGRPGPNHGTQPAFRTLAIGTPAARFVTGPGDVNADGIDDLVLGTANNTAEVIHGARPFPATPAVAATITGTLTVASAPYAAGADVNCDRSSDLLVLPSAPPSAEAFLDFGVIPHIDLSTLPIAVDGAHRDSDVLDLVGRPGTLGRLRLAPPWLVNRLARTQQSAPDTVHVGADYCPSCDNHGRSWGTEAFSSIQAAVDSGARKIILHPGVFRQTFAARGSVDVIGSGAEATIIQPPTDFTPGDPLVVVDGVPDVRLSRLTLDGNDRADGVRVVANADVTLRKLIVRNATTGISADGSAASVAIVNSTIVANGTGFAATSCATVDVRNTIFAYHTGPAMDYGVSGCPAPSLNRYNGFWRNNGTQSDLVIDGQEADVSSVGQGQVPADPRFIDPTHHNYRLGTGSPAIDAGDVSDTPPPGTGARIDLGYLQAGQALFYTDETYTDYGENHGLEWGIDAFDVVGDAVDAAQAALPSYGCSPSAQAPDGCSVQLAVGVGPGAYDTRLTLPSNVRLVGSGSNVTTLTADGSGSVLTLADAANTEVHGFTLTGYGDTVADAAVKLVGATTAVTVSRNVISGHPTGPQGAASGVRFEDNATGLVHNNTIVNSGTGVSSVGTGARVRMVNNIIANNEYGVYVENGTPTNLQVIGDFNLFYGNTRDLPGTSPNVVQGGHDITGQDPRFVNAAAGDYRLKPDSPAINNGDPNSPSPWGGGAFVDIGQHEARPTPVLLLFGQEGQTCATGNSGVARTELGLAHVADPLTPISATLPSSWVTATLNDPGTTGTFWHADLHADHGTGIYRLYARGTDVAQNDNVSFLAQYTGDDSPPTVRWITPAGDTSMTAAAVELVVEASDYVTTTLGRAFSVASVSFEVDGQATEAHWSTSPWREETGAPRVARAVVPLGQGEHSVVAVVEDLAGFVTRSQPRAISLAGDDVATVSAPAPAGATNDTSLAVLGYARFDGGDKKVTVYVDGAVATDAQLADPTADQTGWTAEVSLSGEVTHTLQAVAAGTSLADAATVPVRLDVTAPTVHVSGPAEGDVIPLVATFTGSASDDGLDRVEISTDGGYLWASTQLTATQGTSSPWSAHWLPPTDSDFVRYPIVVRAIDQAGNTAHVAHRVLVDNVPPQEVAGVSFRACTTSCIDLSPGDAFSLPEQLEVTWDHPVIDGSGPATVRLAVTESDTPPPGGTAWKAPTSDGVYKALITTSGTYYTHISASDVADNTIFRSYGPFYAGSTPPLGGSNESPSGGQPPNETWVLPITVDGQINIAGREWHPDTQRLDVDPRAQTPHELLVAWDATDLFFGWRGALWAHHDGAWLFVDTQPGGTRTPPSGQLDAAVTLPLDADFAIHITSALETRVQRFDSAGGWQVIAVDRLAFASGAADDTELRVPRDAIAADGRVALIALSVDANGSPTSVFPTTNALAGRWDDAYVWPALSPDIMPNADQPAAHHSRVSVTSPHGVQAGWGPGHELEYVVRIENTDTEPMHGATLVLSSTRGLTLASLEGVAAPAPAPSDRWTIDLGTLAIGHRAPITLTARLADDLTAVAAVTVTAALDHLLEASEPAHAQSSHGLGVDAEPPHITIGSPDNGGATGSAMMQSGPGVVRGTASDRGGGGLAGVDVRIGDGAWQRAAGAHAWSWALDVPASGAFELAARAVDQHGQFSLIETLQVVADNVPPSVTIEPPNTVLTGTKVILGGTAIDPVPESGGIAAVQIQIDEGPWRTVRRHGREPDGAHTWHFRWLLPVEEGALHAVRARAVDAAGNVGQPTRAAVVTIDNVPPRSTIESPLPGSAPNADTMLVWGTATDGWGIERVEVSADGGRTWSQALLGAEAAALLGRTAPPVAPGDVRLWLPLVVRGALPGASRDVTVWALELPSPPGEIVLRSRAVDRAGNLEPLRQPVRVTVFDAVGRAWLPMAVRGYSHMPD